MDKEDFCKELYNQANKLDIELTQIQLYQFYLYMEQLLEWNEKINLTAITEPNDIILKHFIDSITINKHIEKGYSLIDVGTGAGFPGIPLKILNKDLNVTLLDSLNKRIKFLDNLKEMLDIKDINCLHSRAEEISKNKDYRECFDIVTSRAVARLNTLVEYMIPLVKIGGKCICMKGSVIQEEIEESKKAIEVLGGKIEVIEKFQLPGTDIERNIVIIRKISHTPSQYPRKSGIPSKQPII